MNHADIAATIAEIELSHGAGAIRTFNAEPLDVAVTSTGYPGLDAALGCKGWPNGRIVEVFGPDLAPCRTIAYAAIQQAILAGQSAALVDVEHIATLDAFVAADTTRWKIGTDPRHLLIAQPDNGEQALDIVEALVRSGAVGLVVVDSVGALAPADDLIGLGAEGVVIGGLARMMSKAMRKLCNVTSRTNTTVLFLNPVTRKEGVTFGRAEVTAGGNALKYFASVRVEVRRVDVGHRLRVVKNKLAPPFATVEIDLGADR